MSVSIEYILEHCYVVYDVPDEMVKSLSTYERWRHIRILDCQTRELSTLPTSLPPSLEELYCDDNCITCLPELPASLKHLNCSYNQLKELPTLPPFLKILYCGGNFLKKLPTIPPSLERLHCDNNRLECLPDLSTSIVNLTCSSNMGFECISLAGYRKLPRKMKL